MDVPGEQLEPRVEEEPLLEEVKPPRRWTLRRWMILIAGVGLVLYSMILAYRLLDYPRQAEVCRQGAEANEASAAALLARAGKDPGNAEKLRLEAESFQRKAEFLRSHEARFREHVVRPWVELPRPGPLPD